MSEYVLPVVIALFVWWFSTGVVLMLDRMPRKTHYISQMIATVLALASFYVLIKSTSETTTMAAYQAFVAAILIWGWHELAFLLGIVTGPRPMPCPEGANTSKRFLYAVQALAYHELAILMTLILIWIISKDEVNQVGFWTFLVLFGMRLSAKLNIFLGVPHINEEFLPSHLEFLKSYFARRSMNWLFPISVTVSTLLGAYIFHAAFLTAVTEFAIVSYMLIGTFVLLGMLEHWLLIVRIPDSALWTWAMKATPEEKANPEIVRYQEP
jgi:putative photosynthetic complex assembly protein 2